MCDVCGVASIPFILMYILLSSLQMMSSRKKFSVLIVRQIIHAWYVSTSTLYDVLRKKRKSWTSSEARIAKFELTSI